MVIVSHRVETDKKALPSGTPFQYRVHVETVGIVVRSVQESDRLRLGPR